MLNNFIIVNLGGSGSQFLAKVLNTSKQWTVEHESTYRGNRKMLVLDINKELNRDYFGEVNGFLRFGYDEIKANKKAVVIRNPRDVFTSWYSFTNGELWPKWHEQTERTLYIFDRLIERKDLIIRFDKMTTNKGYLSDVAKCLGINDIDFNNIDMAPTNNHNQGLTWEEIPYPERELFGSYSNFFYTKYRGLLWT